MYISEQNFSAAANFAVAISSIKYKIKLPTSREVGSILYKGESGLHILWGENKNLFVPFFAMVSVVDLNNLNDCDIATDTQRR